MTETAKWYEKAGSCGDVVVSTRVRLARNLKQYPFPARAFWEQHSLKGVSVYPLGEHHPGGSRFPGGAPHCKP